MSDASRAQPLLPLLSPLPRDSASQELTPRRGAYAAPLRDPASRSRRARPAGVWLLGSDAPAPPVARTAGMFIASPKRCLMTHDKLRSSPTASSRSRSTKSAGMRTETCAHVLICDHHAHTVAPIRRRSHKRVYEARRILKRRTKNLKAWRKGVFI
jgi:hypothetical protein